MVTSDDFDSKLKFKILDNKNETYVSYGMVTLLSSCLQCPEIKCSGQNQTRQKLPHTVEDHPRTIHADRRNFCVGLIK